MRLSPALPIAASLCLLFTPATAPGDEIDQQLAVLTQPPAPNATNGLSNGVTRKSEPDPAPLEPVTERLRDLSPRQRATAFLLLLQAASPGGPIGLLAR
ncbi:MAG: hypothetical protein AAF317_20125 [Pseudomonadota bacterium]